MKFNQKSVTNSGKLNVKQCMHIKLPTPQNLQMNSALKHLLENQTYDHSGKNKNTYRRAPQKQNKHKEINIFKNFSIFF